MRGGSTLEEVVLGPPDLHSVCPVLTLVQKNKKGAYVGPRADEDICPRKILILIQTASQLWVDSLPTTQRV